MVKLIYDNGLLELIELYYEFQQTLPFKFPIKVSTIILMGELNKKDAIALGLYKNNKLVGFINGWAETSETFYLANLYIKPGNRLGIKELMSKAEEVVLSLGYTGWIATSYLTHSKKILEKFGGVEI